MLALVADIWRVLAGVGLEVLLQVGPGAWPPHCPLTAPGSARAVSSGGTSGGCQRCRQLEAQLPA